jgi:predicted phosphoribosyltransferase
VLQGAGTRAPALFLTAGQAYRHFGQTTDEEVRCLGQPPVSAASKTEDGRT